MIQDGYQLIEISGGVMFCFIGIGVLLHTPRKNNPNGSIAKWAGLPILILGLAVVIGFTFFYNKIK